MKLRLLILTALLIVMTFGVSQGQAIYLDHVDGLCDEANGYFNDGAILTFHMHVEGDATAHVMMNNGFTFTSAELTWGSVSGEYNLTGYPDLETWFDFVLVINLWANGSVEDTVGTGLLSLFGTGLPVSFDDILYSFTVGPLTGPEGGALVFDSSWYPPLNPWMWDVVEENVAWGGPYTYYLYNCGSSPVISSLPVTEAQVGVEYTYDVDADGDPPPTYSLTVFPDGMTIDEVTGVITWTPTEGQDGDHDVTVRATTGTDATPPNEQLFVVTVSPATGVAYVGGAGIPENFGLGQNYPNPFNPMTEMRFDIPTRSRVQISIYNILGHRVNTLIDQEIGAGTYIATWDGTTSNGQAAPSGVYFYRMTAGNFAQTKKAMLVK